jgi:hypothetical protein
LSDCRTPTSEWEEVNIVETDVLELQALPETEFEPSMTPVMCCDSLYTSGVEWTGGHFCN